MPGRRNNQKKQASLDFGVEFVNFSSQTSSFEHLITTLISELFMPHVCVKLIKLIPSVGIPVSKIKHKMLPSVYRDNQCK
uniref:Uncharacterized protein n=1 Tax=Rhizophora mucronata TaxID=61149 RepID=A0A2P2Q961_RHIMU